MNLDADDPYEILGTTPDATETEVKVAAAKAKRELNPDHFPDEEKKTARRRLYRVREAEQAILEDREMDPTAGERSGGPTTAEQSGGPTAAASTAGDLSVETDADRPSVGTPVSVHVMDSDGEPVSNARVVTDPMDQPPAEEAGDAGQTARTDESGVATLVFDTAGRRRIVATADAEASAGSDGSGDGREFRPGETSVVVTRPTVSLSLAVDAETVTAGSAVSFRVVDDDQEPVRDASVAVAGQTLSTDASGVASTKLHDPGTVRVRATKTESDVRYDPATTTVRVTSLGSIELAVADDRERGQRGRLRVESDETVTFVVRSVEAEQPVGDATLTVTDAGSADAGSDGPAGSPTTETVETADDGRADVTFTEPGRASVEATYGDSVSETVEVVVRRSDAGWESETDAGSGVGGRLAARAVGLSVVVALSGLIGFVVVSDEFPVVLVGGGGAVVALGLVVYLWLVAR